VGQSVLEGLAGRGKIWKVCLRRDERMRKRRKKGIAVFWASGLYYIGILC